MKKTIAALAVILSACGTMNTGIVEIDDNTYMYSKQDWMSHTAGAIKVEMFKEARKFCADKGKKFALVNQQSNDYSIGASAGAEIQFQCV